MAHPPKVLVVDDEPDLVRYLEHVPHRLGYETARAENGSEAIERAVGDCEAHHAGEIRFVVETAFDLPELWHDLPPRQRALQLFGQLGVIATAPFPLSVPAGASPVRT